MFMALVGNDGCIGMIAPHSILRVAPLAGRSRVTLVDGRRMLTQDDIATLRRRIQAVAHSALGRSHLLRRLWMTGMWHATRGGLRLSARRAAR